MTDDVNKDSHDKEKCPMCEENEEKTTKELLIGAVADITHYALTGVLVHALASRVDFK